QLSKIQPTVAQERAHDRGRGAGARRLFEGGRGPATIWRTSQEVRTSPRGEARAPRCEANAPRPGEAGTSASSRREAGLAHPDRAWQDPAAAEAARVRGPQRGLGARERRG